MDPGVQIDSGDINPAQGLYVMMNMMRSQHAVLGPSLDDIESFDRVKKGVADLTQQANGLFAFISGERKKHVKSIELNKDSVDGPELLQVTAGLLNNFINEIVEETNWVKERPFTSSQVRQFSREVDALKNILMKSVRELMEFRQSILYKQGKAPSFRATRHNLEHVATVATRTEVDELDFVEV